MEGLNFVHWFTEPVTIYGHIKMYFTSSEWNTSCHLRVCIGFIKYEYFHLFLVRQHSVVPMV